MDVGSAPGTYSLIRLYNLRGQNKAESYSEIECHIFRLCLLRFISVLLFHYVTFISISQLL